MSKKTSKVISPGRAALRKRLKQSLRVFAPADVEAARTRMWEVFGAAFCDAIETLTSAIKK
jgi:hypothetical protein